MEAAWLRLRTRSPEPLHSSEATHLNSVVVGLVIDGAVHKPSAKIRFKQIKSTRKETIAYPAACAAAAEDWLAALVPACADLKSFMNSSVSSATFLAAAAAASSADILMRD